MLGRQELDAELLLDAEGALWTRAMLDQCRVGQAPETLRRIVVAIDPSGGSSGSNAECGIIVAGAAPGRDGHLYVLDDRSGRYTPKRWAEVAIEASELQGGSNRRGAELRRRNGLAYNSRGGPISAREASDGIAGESGQS
jgi:phage terminase large subunit-like protein